MQDFPLLPAGDIPSESFVTANARIMATVKTGQLTTDHNMGIAGFHSPAKRNRSLLQSSRVALLVDGEFCQPHDEEGASFIRERGYIPGTNIIRSVWSASGLEIEDCYFIPANLDVLVHQMRIRNISAQSRAVKAYALLYPQLGSPVPHQKGVCKRAWFDAGESCVFVEDMQGNSLAYGFAQGATEHQIGQVCGKTDLFLDLEDRRLSGNSELSNMVINAAVGLDIGSLPAGAERTLQLCIGRRNTSDAVKADFRLFKQGAEGLIRSVSDYWKAWLEKGVPALTDNDLDPRLANLDRMSRVVLKSHQTHDGVLMCGSTSSHYQGALAARNSCFSQLAMDRLGYHDEVVPGFELFMEFKVGDDRFSSPDENDQLGTIIHCFRRHYEFTGDLAFLKKQYSGLALFANAILDLVDPVIGLVYSERSIHEFVAISRGYETYVNVMAFRGLADAAFIAKELNNIADAERFAEAAARLRTAILTRLYCSKTRTFAKRIYQGKLDLLPSISLLTPALFGVLDASDPRVTHTLEFVLAHIWDKRIGGLYRYPLHLQPWDEIPYGGPWVTYTCWLARVYIKRGEMDKAKDCIEWVIRNAPADTNTLPEHFSTAHAGQRGFHRVYYEPAIPETWATAEFMMAVMDYQEAHGNTGHDLLQKEEQTELCEKVLK